MKCLTVRQPWAWLIIHGGKNVENRNWETDYRGRLYIHASTHLPKRIFRREWDLAMLKYGNQKSGRPPLIMHNLEFGKIIGHVDLVDIKRNTKGPWVDDRYVYRWILENPRPIEPINSRGYKGLFNVEDRET